MHLHRDDPDASRPVRRLGEERGLRALDVELEQVDRLPRPGVRREQGVDRVTVGTSGVAPCACPLAPCACPLVPFVPFTCPLAPCAIRELNTSIPGSNATWPSRGHAAAWMTVQRFAQGPTLRRHSRALSGAISTPTTRASGLRWAKSAIVSPMFAPRSNTSRMSDGISLRGGRWSGCNSAEESAQASTVSWRSSTGAPPSGRARITVSRPLPPACASQCRARSHARKLRRSAAIAAPSSGQ